MKKLTLLCAGSLFTCMLFAQPSFQTSLEAGISLPLNSNNVNSTHTGKAIHFGNHLDYTFGNGPVRFGLGAYIGYLNAIATDDKYKEIGESIAERYKFTQLTFNSSAFKSTQVLVGPVASFGSGRCNINIWAKAGYGLNEPGRYSVIDKENGAVNNVYINQAGENKNGLAYNAGAGIKYALSEYVGLQLSASYFSTQTDQVNYNFDREKGLTPLFFTASNQFIQASAGLHFTIGNPKKNKTGSNDFGSAVSDTGNPTSTAVQKIKTKSNIKNDRLVNNNNNNGVDNPDVNPTSTAMQKFKTKSNIKNGRLSNNNNNNGDDNPDNDSLYFSPEKIELRSQITVNNNPALQSVDKFLTGFVYQGADGNVISQCGANAMPGDPVPGIDVKLKRIGSTGNDVFSTKTNRDGSFSFNNITPGNYNATVGTSAMNVTVNGNSQNDFKILDINGASCGNTKENYIITDGDKTYVEVINADETGSRKKHPDVVKFQALSVTAPRDAASGMASGRRMHKPFLVSNTDFDVNMDNIVSNDGKLYAEVIASREAATGIASGRSTIVTGDVDGDGITDFSVLRKHPANVKYNNFKTSMRETQSGLPAEQRMHKPMVITKELNVIDDGDEITAPRDAASGLATGKRMHKPMVITKELYITDDADEIDAPRDAATGMASGKRMHKPMTVTKEIGVTDDGEEVVVYTIIHRDIAARNILEDDDNDAQQKMAITEQGVPRTKGHKKEIITGDDNDIVPYKDGEAFSSKKSYDYYNALAQEGVTSNPLYQQNGNAGVNPLNGKSNGSNNNAVQNNPLYESTGTKGENPLFESKSDLRVIGSNGKGHDIFIPSNIVINAGNEQTIVPFSNYDVMPVKWMAPESMSSKKGIQEKGIKKISVENSENNSERKGWDGTVKGNSKNINTSEAGVGTGHGVTIDSVSNTARKGWDGTVNGGAIVKEISRVHCADGTCSIDAIVQVDGKEYEALITGVMKTKHDTVKNSISNIR